MPASERLDVVYDADNTLRLIELVDKRVPPGSDPIPVTTATVTGNIKSPDAVVVVGPLTYTQIGATNSYEALLSQANTVILGLGNDYEIEVVADDGADRVRTIVYSLQVIEG